METSKATDLPRANPIIRAKVVAVLVNPDDEWTEEVTAEVMPGTKRQQVALELLAAIRGAGGLVKLGADDVRFIPLSRVKEITVTFPAIEIASAMPRLN